MMATVPHVTSGLGLRKFQADGFLLTRVYEVATYPISVLHCFFDGIVATTGSLFRSSYTKQISR